MAMGRESKHKFNLKVSSSSENLEIIREFINRIAVKGGFDTEAIEQIELAVDEACTNVIKHAHQYNSKKTLELTVNLDINKIEIIISDKGKGFNISHIAKPDIEKSIHEAKAGGLGIHLMRTLMDEVKFNFNPGKTNKLSLTKYLRKSA